MYLRRVASNEDLLPVGCRSDEGLSAPIIKRMRDGVTDQAAVSVGAIPSIGVYVDLNKFASAYASVYQGKSQGYGKVYVTRNLMGKVLYPEGPIHQNSNF